jgi:hypothetical protein
MCGPGLGSGLGIVPGSGAGVGLGMGGITGSGNVAGPGRGGAGIVGVGAGSGNLSGCPGCGTVEGVLPTFKVLFLSITHLPLTSQGT